MANSIFAYAFLKAAYAEGARNPLDALVPLVKRALMGAKSTTIDAADIQKKIRTTLGLSIPINVVRYTFPILGKEGILRLNSNHIYELVSAGFNDESLDNIETQTRDRIIRVRKKLNRVFLDYDFNTFSPDEFLEAWLDSSSLSFFGGLNPAFNATPKDRELNRLIYILVEKHDRDGEFLSDLTEIVLGDAIYRAITAITEYEYTGTNSEINLKMSEVDVFFDTRYLMRVLGIGVPSMVTAARELLSLCKSTGCQTFAFDHTVEEIQRILRTVSDRLVYGLEIEGDVAAYAFNNGLEPGDLIAYAAEVPDRLKESGIAGFAPPPYLNELGIDELSLDRQLKLDLKQASDQARVTDIKSLSAIFRARQGAAKSNLEKSEAILITTNKGLSDSSVRFFQNHFMHEGRTNSVQLCMTDVVFSTRLWTKLPTSVDKLPTTQVVAHLLGAIRPSAKLREQFMRNLKESVDQGTMTEEAAARLKLSAFVDQALATEFPTNQTEMTRTEFVGVATRVIRIQRDMLDQVRKGAESGVRERAKAEMDEALERFSILDTQFSSKEQEVSSLRSEVELNRGRLAQMETASEIVTARVRKVGSSIGILLIVGAILWLSTLVLNAIDLDERLIASLGLEQYKPLSASVSMILNIVMSAALTGLTVFGLSVAGFRQIVESKITTWILTFVFGQHQELAAESECLQFAEDGLASQAKESGEA